MPLPELTPDERRAASARIRADGPITIAAAAKFVPTSHGIASPDTLWRWIVIGKRGVRLDGARLVGKTWWTSRQALERFWDELAAAEYRSKPFTRGSS